MYHAINPGTDEALAQQALQKLLMLSFTILDHRRQEQDSGPFLKRQHTIHHFTHRARREGNAMIRASGFSDPSVEQSQVVVDLGHGPHGRARVM